MPRIAAVSIIALMLLAGCASDSRHESSALSFRVDPARLGDRFEDPGAGLALRAPAGWGAVPESLLAAARARLHEVAPQAADEQQMLALYRQADDGAMLIVSRFAAEVPAASRDSLALLHLRKLKAEHPGAQVDDGRFTYHGYEIVQLRTVDSTTVAFKLLLSRAALPLVQLDYVVPRSAYPRELESIESSIGSLEPKS